jgi:sRNA-binding carbon storage regulator CsrA
MHRHPRDGLALRTWGGRGRLGFEVDRDLPVHRSEVWERIHANDASEGFLEELAKPAAR